VFLDKFFQGSIRVLFEICRDGRLMKQCAPGTVPDPATRGALCPFSQGCPAARVKRAIAEVAALVLEVAGIVLAMLWSPLYPVLSVDP
jgi:hypothetical protein